VSNRVSIPSHKPSRLPPISPSGDCRRRAPVGSRWGFSGSAIGGLAVGTDRQLWGFVGVAAAAFMAIVALIVGTTLVLR